MEDQTSDVGSSGRDSTRPGHVNDALARKVCTYVIAGKHHAILSKDWFIHLELV